MGKARFRDTLHAHTSLYSRLHTLHTHSLHPKPLTHLTHLTCPSPSLDHLFSHLFLLSAFPFLFPLLALSCTVAAAVSGCQLNKLISARLFGVREKHETITEASVVYFCIKFLVHAIGSRCVGLRCYGRYLARQTGVHS